ncbi:hypothetical protein ACFTWF_15725 [Rhodococcus sp. NPDC056960]|uniref:hypothetical protein n=1 Tax=Rhodococcus sp. NPDC056960 TaxID=3345982 RepID=UPI00363B4508
MQDAGGHVATTVAAVDPHRMIRAGSTANGAILDGGITRDVLVSHQSRPHPVRESPELDRPPFSDTTWLGSHGPPWCCPQRRPRDSADRKVQPFFRHDLRDAATIKADEDLCTAQRYLIALANATDIDDPNSPPRYDRTTATTRFETFCDEAADKLGIVTRGAYPDSSDHRARCQS